MPPALSDNHHSHVMLHHDDNNPDITETETDTEIDAQKHKQHITG
jgi:hypothetical protein